MQTTTPSPAALADRDRDTTKLDAFLRETTASTPFVVVDVDHVELRYRQLVESLPTARVHYAVKANPGRPIIERLVGLGSSFDVASPAEIDICLAAGAEPSAISYGNTIKKRRDIAYAASCGIDLFSLDADEELDKILDIAPHAEVCVRLRHECGGADWPLSRKFGSEEHEVVGLLVRAHEAGLRAGVSFHVGSQQRDVAAWDEALAVAARISRRAADRGAEVAMLNLGGGFPGSYVERSPAISTYGAAIAASLRRWFPAGAPALMIEPGRYLVADAGVLRTEVVLVSRRSPLDTARWVYVDCGKFHGLAETMDEAIRYRLRTAHDGGATAPVVLAGPTCDSTDVLYEKSDYELPLALAEGDMIDILSTGAYTTTYSSVGFNGFAPLAEHFI